MPAPCLLKLPDNTWVHYTRGIRNAKARDFNGEPTQYALPENDPFLHPDGPFAKALPATMSEADAVLAGHFQLPYRLEKLPHEEVEQWRRALDLLESLDWTPGGPPPGRIVPQTDLRKLYLQLRNMPFAEQETMANNPDTPPRLQRLFEESVGQFKIYENGHDTFCPTRIWWTEDQTAAFSAHELQAMLDPAKVQPGNILWSSDGPALGFTTVDYEVSPLRTTNYAVVDDGTRVKNSGLGGMDLLLRSEDGVPVVAEIKGQDDTNMLLALVQALTYTVELTTPHQFRRLKKSYPEAFRDLETESPRSDVSIIYLGADNPPLKEASMQIVREMMRGNDSAVARAVRRIAFLRVQLDGESKLRFSCEKLVPSP